MNRCNDRQDSQGGKENPIHCTSQTVIGVHCRSHPIAPSEGRGCWFDLSRPRQRITSVAAGQFRSEAGADLPQFVKDEFDAFLECGILAHGFLRLRCGDCGHDKLIAILCPLIKEFLAAPAP